MLDWDSMLIGPCVAAFGEPVTYTQPGQAAQSITAVFQASSLQLLPLGGARGSESMLLGASGDVTTREPILGVRLSQLQAPPAQGDTAYVFSARALYQVKEVLPDGLGHAKLTLTLVQSF